LWAQQSVGWNVKCDVIVDQLRDLACQEGLCTIDLVISFSPGFVYNLSIQMIGIRTTMNFENDGCNECQYGQ